MKGSREAPSGSVRAAAAQLAPVLDEAGGTLGRVLDVIGEAAAQGVELLVLPETLLPYYPYFAFVEPPVQMGPSHLALYERAIVVPGPETGALSAAAARHGMVLVVGVNERDHGSLYNTQLVFDADGRLLLRRRKLTPTYHERMVWGRGDGSGLRVVDTRVGAVGALACWEHYNPLARYALMTQHEAIHAAQFPGSMVGPVFGEQTEVTIRHHALESGCFVVCATGWLDDAQREAIAPDPALRKTLSGGCFTAIVSPEGRFLAEPLTEGEGLVVADLDLALITKRKRMMDSVGHYARPELFSFRVDEAAHAPHAGPAAHAPLEHADGPPAPEPETASPGEIDDGDAYPDQRAPVLRPATARS